MKSGKESYIFKFRMISIASDKLNFLLHFKNFSVISAARKYKYKQFCLNNADSNLINIFFT